MKVLFIVAQLFSLVYSNNRFNQKLFNQKLFLVRQSLIKPSGQEHGTDYQAATQKNEVFHPSCLNNNTWLGPKVLNTKIRIKTPEDCHKRCIDTDGCDAFTWTNNRLQVCFLYRQKDIRKWTPNTATYKDKTISYFMSCGRLICSNEPIVSPGQSEGPVKIGGRCPKREEWECDGNCQLKSKPCNGKCSFGMCRKGKECLEIIEGGMLHGRILRRSCNGVCQDTKKKCNGKCDIAQCWEEGNGVCLQPGYPGGEGWKRCGNNCTRDGELCQGGCGDNFCWDPERDHCRSTKERNKEGSLVRRNCDCICHPYESLCGGRCDRSQCQDGDKCLEELQMKDGQRVRTSCEGKCVPWGQKCVFRNRK